MSFEQFYYLQALHAMGSSYIKLSEGHLQKTEMEMEMQRLSFMCYSLTGLGAWQSLLQVSLGPVYKRARRVFHSAYAVLIPGNGS